MGNVQDAPAAAIELYEDQGKPLSAELRQDPEADTVSFDLPIAPFYELGAGGEILITAWGSCATRPA